MHSYQGTSMHPHPPRRHLQYHPQSLLHCSLERQLLYLPYNAEWRRTPLWRCTPAHPSLTRRSGWITNERKKGKGDKKLLKLLDNSLWLFIYTAVKAQDIKAKIYSYLLKFVLLFIFIFYILGCLKVLVHLITLSLLCPNDLICLSQLFCWLI